MQVFPIVDKNLNINAKFIMEYINCLYGRALHHIFSSNYTAVCVTHC